MGFFLMRWSCMSASLPRCPQDSQHVGSTGMPGSRGAAAPSGTPGRLARQRKEPRHPQRGHETWRREARGIEHAVDRQRRARGQAGPACAHLQPVPLHAQAAGVVVAAAQLRQFPAQEGRERHARLGESAGRSHYSGKPQTALCFYLRRCRSAAGRRPGSRRAEGGG